MTHQFTWERNDQDRLVTVAVKIPIELLADFAQSSEFARLTLKCHGHANATASELLFVASEVVKFSEERITAPKGGNAP